VKSDEKQIAEFMKRGLDAQRDVDQIIAKAEATIRGERFGVCARCGRKFSGHSEYKYTGRGEKVCQSRSGCWSRSR